METKTMKTVFTVVERGQGKSFWTRVGVGFVNQDGSWNLRLDAIPVNGVLQVREWEPSDRRDARTTALELKGARAARPAARRSADGAAARRRRRREAPHLPGRRARLSA